jgi:hypothetical protein
MAFSRGWDISNAVELRPLIDCWIVTPNVVEPLKTIRTTEAIIISVAVAALLAINTYRYILSLKVIIV